MDNSNNNGQEVRHCPACGNVLDDRAGDTSRRSGNSPAFVLSEPVTQPNKHTQRELAELLSKKGVGGEVDSIEFLINKVGFNTIRNIAATIERRRSKYEVNADNIMAFINFDREMQALLLKGIGIVELQFRTQYAYFMANEHGSFAHCDAGNFKELEHYEEFWVSFERELNYKVGNGNKYLKKKLDRYGNIPIWDMVNMIPLGTLSKLYRNTKSRAVRFGVADTFGTTYTNMVSWLRTICEVRNRCAHFDDVCITPLACRPKKIKGLGIPNDSAFYAFLIIELLIEGGITVVNDDVEYSHYTIFSNDLLSLGNDAPTELFMAAGFPPSWSMVLQKASSLINQITRVTT